MPTQAASSNAPSWRRGRQVGAGPQPVPAHGLREHHANRKDKDKPDDNWRAHAHPITGSTRLHPGSSSRSQPLSISTPYDRAVPTSSTSARSSSPSKPSLLSSSLKREKPGMLDADWVPGHHPHPDPNAPHAIKPSGMGNGIIGRAPELGTSPTKPKGSNFPTARHHWPLSSSLEKNPTTGPATHLHPLRIEPEGSHFFPQTSTPLKVQKDGHTSQLGQRGKQDSNRDDNWMLTPTSSLPSISNTPNRVRESSTDKSLGPGQLGQQIEGPPGSSLRTSPSIRGPVEHFHASVNNAPRTPSPGFAFTRQEGGFTGTSLFNRGPNVNVQSSPKRSPLVFASMPHRQNVGSVTGTPVFISPTTSPKLSHRTLSPVSRHPPVIAEAPTNGDRVVNSIASILNWTSTQTRPGPASRRESFNSVVSGGAGHTMSHSRRSSTVFSPNSPTVSSRIGVYRPPHLRNRGSVSGLKSSVAHYDRVRTPSLRGLSRSRESSISLSRPTSRPPSTVPFYNPDSIPEDGQTDDASRAPSRGRQSNMSIHLPDLIADQQQRNAAAAAAASTSEDGEVPAFAPNTTHLLDSASLLAKLRAQLVRREAAASDVAASEMDRNSVTTEDNEQEFFDLADMMEYGASEGHPLSRYGSSYALESHPLGDVFEIGDLLGPGLEHDGHVIKIAETTSGFVDQNEDLTGSKLEVIRKLGEGSYAVVYLVREVSAEEAASYTSQNSVAIPNSTSGSGVSEAHGRNPSDDADLTMVASSEDFLSTTLKADGKGKDEGFHNSPALEERRRKDLKIDTRLCPGKEFALKCLCKRDLEEDMLEVQRLEATIHQSIPAHPNIVTLYRTYETPDWLFLVLEYCPGQDLYYWLEKAQDAGQPTATVEEVYGKTITEDDHAGSPLRRVGSGNDSDNYGALGSSLDATPPSPSLLASTSGHNLLSKRRIRLIARMFRQICDAVQFCHDRGVSHRDIKPENFIVEDRRTVEEMQSACPDISASTLVESSHEDTQVIVKMTDFGLATAEDRCDDFECGSKPYMAFECHNNVSETYDPKQADIWSLGVVLLNLLFHRSPFTEPSTACPSFSAYCEDPIRFLMESFDGLTETVARFLSENVFCSVSDDDDASQKRISAGEFSRWACGLVDHMGLSGPGPGRMSQGASIYATVPLIHSRTGSMSTLPSLLSSPRPGARSVARDTDHLPGFDMTADATFRAALASARQGSLSPHPALFTPDVLPSPTFTPAPQPFERNPFDTQYDSTADAGRATETIVEQEERNSPETLSHQHDFATLLSGLPQSASGNFIDDRADEASGLGQGASEGPGALLANVEDPSQDVPPDTHPKSNDSTKEALPEDTGEEETEIRKGAKSNGEAKEHNGDGDGGDDDKPESIATSNNSKRRKRGARKGRTLAKHLKRSQSVEGMADIGANDPEARARERERTIRELALVSENLARQMSKMAKASDAADSLASPQIVLSKPTAEAAARYSLQTMADGNSEAHKATDDASAFPATSAANWNSAALRRERMTELRKAGAGVLQDSGKSRVMSWREQNRSAATLSSLSSSVTTASSHSSTSSATSSIYSTASAPAALPRKDVSARNRTRGSGFGLDTISERERTAAPSKEVDAQYLAGIFGGGAEKRKESTAARPNESSAPNSDVPNDRGNKLFSLLSDSNGKVNGTALLGVAKTSEASQAATANGAGQRSVSASSSTSTSSNTGVAASFVSRFRRPGSSSSSTNKNIAGADPEGDKQSASASGEHLGGSLGMRRDASTSTNSLQGTKDDLETPAPAVVSTKSNGSSGGSSNKNTTEAGTEAPKKRGMGKFFSGVRESIKNF
ncbi:uncharacterized protein UBRO2_02815 [Ustilago bromivora]|uniref:Protein kinase domain-containing protein n=1 Tax=Ustilago bromivora TaxID=307758 RepID=A0A8H8QMP2_9BASI|nr:uncharacterized protein UBRO2_02815 [Ustilago bromivora]